MVCGGDTTLNNSAVKNTIKTEYSRILSQASPAHRGFPIGKVRQSRTFSSLKKYTALMKNINHSIYKNPSQK